MEWVWRARVVGPLAPHVDGVRSELARLGYTRASAEQKVWMMGHLSRWLTDKGLEPRDLTQDRIAQFLTVFGAGWKETVTERRMAPILAWLRASGVVPPLGKTTPPTQLDLLLQRYHGWLVEDRYLSARTIGRYETTARRFLEARQGANRRTGVECLTGADVTAFLLAECSRLGIGSAKGRVAELSFALEVFVSGRFDPNVLGQCCSAGCRLARYSSAGHALDQERLRSFGKLRSHADDWHSGFRNSRVARSARLACSRGGGHGVG